MNVGRRATLRVLVVGGAGGVGEGIVRALLASTLPGIGEVIVSSRDGERLRALRESLGGDPRIRTIVGSVASSHVAAHLRDAASEAGPLDIVIASLGGWWTGPSLTGIDDATWHAAIDTLLSTHWVCARTFVPFLAGANSKYLAIGGGAALVPVASASLVSIAGAAQIMLTRALASERGPAQPPLIAELLIDGPIATSAAHHGPRSPNEITARAVGDAIVPWVLHEGAPDEARFAWPSDRLERFGPIWTLHP